MTELASQDTHFDKARIIEELAIVIKAEAPEKAKRLIQEAIRVFRSLKEPWWVADALTILSFLTNSVKERIKFYEESLAIRRKQGDLRGIAVSLRNLSTQAARLWQFEKAERLLRESLEVFTELDDRHQILVTYGSLGAVLVWQGRFVEARSLYRETLANYHNLEYSQSFATLFHVLVGFPDLYLGEYSRRPATRHSKLSNCWEK